METTANSLYEQYRQEMAQIADVRYAAAVLQWDQETYLPPKGAASRGRQIATLSEIAHQRFTSPQMGNMLAGLNGTSLAEDQQRNIALSTEDYEKATKLSPAFVRQMSEAVSAAFYSWIEARKQNDFKVFQPQLATIVELKKQEAELLGYEQHPYNALLNDYEKGANVTMLDKIFSDVRAPLLGLLDMYQSGDNVDDRFLRQHFPKDEQWKWGLYLAKQLGFDFEAGRQDISEHPFSTAFNSHDVRITTRVDEHDFNNMTWSTIHEVGHALYEQGLPLANYGLPLGEYASLSIHESQSRLWENCVGRGLPFWQHYFPALQEHFPQQFGGVTWRQFVRAINKVEPSFIRTEADELTYHFHVMIRYEIEKELISGNLPVADIPAYWNEQYKNLLGVVVPDDKQGCLQDVHWSHGSFGYFPTYSLGSFYAAQFWRQAQHDIPNLDHAVAQQGDTLGLLHWLRSNIHAVGRKYTSNELCQALTGIPLDSTVFIDYLRQKLEALKQL